MYIYKIINKVNKKVYIGKSNDAFKRFQRHKDLSKNPDTKFHFAMKKYGIENFELQILYKCQSNQEANNKERYYIELYDSINTGYNLTIGGDGGDYFTFLPQNIKDKILKKRSESMKGKNKGKLISEKQKEQIRIKLIGRKISEIVKIKMSESQKIVQNKLEVRTKKHNSMLNKHHTEKTKNKISESLLGKPKSIKARQNMSKSRKGIPWTKARRLAQLRSNNA